MPYDEYGRWIANTAVYPTPNYRDELQRQRAAIDRQLEDYNMRYPPQVQMSQSPQQQPIVQSAQPVAQRAPSYIVVDNEKEAKDYPIVNKIDDEIGKVHFFVTRDESSIFAKRINPSTFEMEFEHYVRQDKVTEVLQSSTDTDGELLQSIDSRLQKLEQVVDIAMGFFLNGDTSKLASKLDPKDSKKSRAPNLPAVKDDGNGGE